MNRALPPLVFLGTPAFAVPSLVRLVEAGAEIRLVVTQPDRPSGRGRLLRPPEVKIVAERFHIPVYQPHRIRLPEVNEKVVALRAECAVVVAYGQILPKSFLDLFPLGVLNVHASLLPLYRGAAPIQRCLMSGEKNTGVSIMLLDQGMDTGPVFGARETEIKPADTFGLLYDRLSSLGGEYLVEVLENWKAGVVTPVPQDDALATAALPITREEARLCWDDSAASIVNTIRALDPRPGAYTFYSGRRIKCFGAELQSFTTEGSPGEIVGLSEQGLLVIAGDLKTLLIHELQMEGQKRMAAADMIRGRSIHIGSHFDLAIP